METQEDTMQEEEISALDAILTGESEVEDADDEPNIDDVKSLEDLEAYKERLHKRNVSLRKAKKAGQRKDEEIAALREQLIRLEGRVEAGARKEEPGKELDMAQWSEKVVDDPSAALEFANAKINDLEGRLANTLKQFEDRLSGRLKQVDPDVVQFRDKIELLKNREEFAGMDDDTLLKVAKVLSAQKARMPRPLSGGRAVAPKSKAIDPVEAAKNDEELMAKFGY